MNKKCNIIGNEKIFNYTKEEESEILLLPNSLQTGTLINGLKTYLITRMDLCKSGNITTKTEIEIISIFKIYIIGDIIDDIKWDNTLFTDKWIELRLLYWNNGQFIGKYNNISMRMIKIMEH